MSIYSTALTRVNGFPLRIYTLWAPSSWPG